MYFQNTKSEIFVFSNQFCFKSGELVLFNKWMKACEAVDSFDKKVAIQNVTGSPTVYLHQEILTSGRKQFLGLLEHFGFNSKGGI